MSKMDEAEKTQLRSIRSFVKREGKMTVGQQNAIDQLWPKFGVEPSNLPLNMNDLFGRDAATILEIGFGNGLSLVEMAEAFPAQNFFGIEVHKPGVGSLLVQVKKRGLKNVRVSDNDAVDVLAQQIPENSLQRAQLFFPDPWHKKRHHKRRLIQRDFINGLAGKLQPGGVIHVATDWEDYAEHILNVMSKCPVLENTTLGYAPKPDYRPLTKYEARGRRLGHGVWDMVFKKKCKVTV